jgi:hypothetical protein
MTRKMESGRHQSCPIRRCIFPVMADVFFVFVMADVFFVLDLGDSPFVCSVLLDAESGNDPRSATPLSRANGMHRKLRILPTRVHGVRARLF